MLSSVGRYQKDFYMFAFMWKTNNMKFSNANGKKDANHYKGRVGA